MKKIFSLAVVAVVALSASAQNIQLGIKGGLNASNLSNINDTEAKIGFNAGVTADYQLAESLYVLSGLEYTTKGAKFSVSGSTQEYSSTLSYLQLPIHAGYKMSIADNTRLVLHAGPYLAYALSAKTKAGSEKTNVINDTNRFDAGLGGGAKVELGKISVGLGVDYGLTTVNKDTEGGKNRNMNASLSVGYKF